MINKKLLQDVTESLTMFLQEYDPELATDPETPANVIESLSDKEGMLETIGFLLSVIEDIKS